MPQQYETHHAYNDTLLYTQFFNLEQLPFSLTPDPQFFFTHAAAQDALNKLFFATRSGEGFTKVIGEVGTGKTLLCRTFLHALGDQYLTAYIPNPYLEPMTLLLAIADELGIEYAERPNQHTVLKSIVHFLIDTYASSNRVVVLCLDEAHAMPLPTLEALRLLSNMETPKRKLMQLVLFGQPELDARLDQSAIRQLKQRISFSANLAPLTATECEDYIQHRLNIAGYRGPRLFSHVALRTLYTGSGGIPRLLNMLAHKSLIAAYAEGARRVSDKHVTLAIEDTDTLPAHNLKQLRKARFRRIFSTFSAVTVIATGAALLHSLA
ncbi:MAG: AAA family ATPase [Pseudomonadota bacterium]